MRILVVEDEPKMAALLRRALVEEGIAVDLTGSAADGLWLAGLSPYDAIVLDRMLPDGDGLDVCRQLRSEGTWTPVLVLTARDTLSDKVGGLDAGADDYLVKPFALAELLARLRALIRREWGARPAVIEVGGVRLDPAARRVWSEGREVLLTAKELALLELFLRRPGQVLTRAEIVEHVWDFAFEYRSNVVDVHIRNLRDKLGRNCLQTLRGVGYRWSVS